MSASVLIPSLNGEQALVELVELLDGEEVLIADNGIRTGVRDALRARGASVVEMGGNVGFGRALNSLAAMASGQTLVVLNDDLVPEPELVKRLVAPCGKDAAMVAGVLLMSESPGVIETAGLVVDAVLNSYDYLQGEPVDRAVEVGPPLGPCAAAAAYDRAAFDEVGGFDEGFFAYCEDVDLAIRIRAIGGRCALAPHARAVHLGSGTLGYHTLEKAILVGESRGYLWRKYGVSRRPLDLMRVLGLELIACAVLYRRLRSWEPARARIRGFRRCQAHCAVPEGLEVAVSFREGLRRRYSRSLRKPLDPSGSVRSVG
jgi:GT2 family glycosyltransferase